MVRLVDAWPALRVGRVPVVRFEILGDVWVRCRSRASALVGEAGVSPVGVAAALLVAAGWSPSPHARGRATLLRRPIVDHLGAVPGLVTA